MAMTWKIRSMLVIAVLSTAFACGNGSDDGSGGASRRAEGDACTVIGQLRTSGPTGLELTGSAEWYSRMVQVTDLYRQLQQAAPDDVADEISQIVAAQEVLLTDLEPSPSGRAVDPATASARVEAYVNDPALADSATAFSDYLASVDCP